ncbi:MAG: Holliday junction branch migration protein RuvA [Bacilli bacterium]|nr:Holliday junction branch migration protein RuvA [Bacilli bacterium]
MFDYLRGIISKTLANYVVVDVNGVGYKVYTPNPYKFKEGSESIVYVYNHIREDENSLYGFASEEERELFLKLIDVKGLGPKMAMPILATGSISGIADAIDRENVLYLKKFPKIGEKLARQIILDLKGKLVLSENISSSTNDELILALESLGYKTNDIKNIVVKVDTSLPIESQIKEALKLLLK